MLLGPCSFWVLAFYYHLSISYNHCGDGGETAILCYILTAGQHSFQRFAISLRADFNHPSQYLCVSMMIGDGVDHAGQWLDGECHGDKMWGICELF